MIDNQNPFQYILEYTVQNWPSFILALIILITWLVKGIKSATWVYFLGMASVFVVSIMGGTKFLAGVFVGILSNEITRFLQEKMNNNQPSRKRNDSESK